MDHLLSFLLLMASLCTAATAATRPHIILIVADDLGYNDVSFHGSDQIATPNIDSLAYNGIILNNYYVSPICTPTRSALMTGRHPIHTGMQNGVIVGDSPYGLPLNETIMPQYFQELGYRRHIVGKWHLGFFAKEYTPTYRGFESHLGYWLGAEDYFDHTAEANMKQWGLDFRRNMEALHDQYGNYSTEIFTQEAVSIIHNHNPAEPLLLYLPYQAVHSGNPNAFTLQAPKKYVDRFPHIENIRRRLLAGMISALDDGVGEVMKALGDSGLLNNSIIVFTTDNGGPSNGFDFNAASNFPLRGVKATLWEGGVRGVGVVHSPLLQKSGYVSEQMLHVTDWLPTLYRAAGGDPRKLKHPDGFDSWEMLSTNGKPVRTEMLHNIDPRSRFGGLRVGDYKLLTGDVGMNWDGWYPPWQLTSDNLYFHVDNYTKGGFPREYTSSHGYLPKQNSGKSRRSQFSPVTVNCGPKPANASTNCDPTKSPCLFHIPSDPCEFNNIADERKDIVIQLLTRLEQYSYTMVPPVNKPSDDRGNPSHHGGVWDPWVNL
ncbi:arylsulfatase B-like [Haliotis rufescens]|uniref:arylsulfatase B-like n=1 Tax=Haliotis rufescens TaxID=6454 RepID=UPI00201FA830|nr:arylsulfatase B-like [Haliotis rufescens]XP_046329324.2 arylsulfatase B-like [Haliotis rufescens]